MAPSTPDTLRVACVGGAAIDRTYRGRAALRLGTSNPVEGRRGFGGVARNVAESLARLGIATGLVTAVGDDEGGRALLRHLQGVGVRTEAVLVRDPGRTAEYAAVLEPDGSLLVGLADMAILDGLAPEDLDPRSLAATDWVFADCNLPAAVLAHLVAHRPAALAVDAVSVPKARRLPRDLAGIDLLFLNADEAAAFLGVEEGAPAVLVELLHARGAMEVVLTRGGQGALVGTADGVVTLPAVPAVVADVTGAGDALIAGTLAGRLVGEPTVAAVRTGALLATLTIEAEGSVHPELSPGLLAASRHRLETILEVS